MAQGADPIEHQSTTTTTTGLPYTTMIKKESSSSPSDHHGWVTIWPSDAKRGSKKRRYLHLLGSTLTYYEHQDDALRENKDQAPAATKGGGGVLTLTSDSVVTTRKEQQQQPSSSSSSSSSSPSATEQQPHHHHHHGGHGHVTVVVKTPTKELCFRSEKMSEQADWIRHIQSAIDGLKPPPPPPSSDKGGRDLVRAAPAAGLSPLSSNGSPTMPIPNSTTTTTTTGMTAHAAEAAHQPSSSSPPPPPTEAGTTTMTTATTAGDAKATSPPPSGGGGGGEKNDDDHHHNNNHHHHHNHHNNNNSVTAGGPPPSPPAPAETSPPPPPSSSTAASSQIPKADEVSRAEAAVGGGGGGGGGGDSSSTADATRGGELTAQLSGDIGGGVRSDGGTATIVHVASSEAAVALNLEDERVSGWVKKSRRKLFLVLQGHTLEFYNSTTELYANKPPKEVVTLTPECTIESRKVPARTSATSSASTMLRTTTSTSGGGGGGGGPSPSTNIADPPFADSQEPDSVIDIHLSQGGQPSSSAGAAATTITLQCFSVEEENRWISHLQIALGTLGGSYDPLKQGIGPDGKLRRPGEVPVPKACCTVS